MQRESSIKLTKEVFTQAVTYAETVVDQLNTCVTPFQTINHCKERLASKGFTELSELDKWNLAGGGKYYLSRNNSTLVAFVVGNDVKTQGVDHMKILGCHTDSPLMKIAPISRLVGAGGFEQVNVQLYGGGLWNTWFDRDLTLAGRVIVKD